MLSIISHQRNANQNHEIPLHTVRRMTRIKSQIITSVDKDVEKSKSLYTSGTVNGNVK